jgi:hypothetical protein
MPYHITNDMILRATYTHMSFMKKTKHGFSICYCPAAKFKNKKDPILLVRKGREKAREFDTIEKAEAVAAADLSKRQADVRKTLAKEATA